MIPESKIDKKSTSSFSINNALVGMEINVVDDAILNYLNFLSGILPITNPTFFHVLPKYTSLDPFFEWDDKKYVRDEVLFKAVEKKLIENVNAALLKVNAIQPEYQISHGDLLTSYMEAIKEFDPALLILGKKSKANYHSVLAKNLLRNSDKNLLLIPSDAALQLDTILVPVDFSDNSGRAIQTAVAMRKSMNKKARIVCLNVYESPELNTYKISRSYAQYESILRDNIAVAFESFFEKFIPNDNDGVTIDFVKKDMPGYGRYINRYANEQNFDLIIMGTKGHSKAHYMFLGSTTEKMLGINEKIPMLVVK